MYILNHVFFVANNVQIVINRLKDLLLMVCLDSTQLALGQIQDVRGI